MSQIPLHLSYDESLDWLEAPPFGSVMDRQGHDRWRGVSERFGYFLDQPEGEEIGFKIIGFSDFDPEDDEHVEIFTGPRFDAPSLGLTGATAGEIALAAGPFLQGCSTVDRDLFTSAMNMRGAEALAYWRATLQAGNLMAHYGAGYTLLALGEPRLAYRHLRAYTELVHRDPWAWVYRGRAALRIGEPDEARTCCEQALELEELTEEETDAGELLAEIDRIALHAHNSSGFVYAFLALARLGAATVSGGVVLDGGG